MRTSARLFYASLLGLLLISPSHSYARDFLDTARAKMLETLCGKRVRGPILRTGPKATELIDNLRDVQLSSQGGFFFASFYNDNPFGVGRIRLYLLPQGVTMCSDSRRIGMDCGGAYVSGGSYGELTCTGFPSRIDPSSEIRFCVGGFDERHSLIGRDKNRLKRAEFLLEQSLCDE